MSAEELLGRILRIVHRYGHNRGDTKTRKIHSATAPERHFTIIMRIITFNALPSEIKGLTSYSKIISYIINSVRNIAYTFKVNLKKDIPYSFYMSIQYVIYVVGSLIIFPHIQVITFICVLFQLFMIYLLT